MDGTTVEEHNHEVANITACPSRLISRYFRTAVLLVGLSSTTNNRTKQSASA